LDPRYNASTTFNVPKNFLLVYCGGLFRPHSRATYERLFSLVVPQRNNARTSTLAHMNRKTINVVVGALALGTVVVVAVSSGFLTDNIGSIGTMDPNKTVPMPRPDPR
jgi:hypothetical protein